MFGRKKSVTGDRVAAAPAEPADSAPSTTGPHDRSSVGDVARYYTDLGYGHIDLGSLVIGVPKGRDLNVALDPNGQPEFHVVTSVSRVIPRAFAAPKSAGQWRTMVAGMREQLEAQGAEVTVVDGPWGRELVAAMPGAVFRAIGVDGHRWTAEVRIMATPELAEQAAEEGREVFAHLMINRGDGPMPVSEALPLTIPDEIQQALVKAQSQLAAQQQAQAYQQQMAAGQQGQAAPQVRPQAAQNQAPSSPQAPASTPSPGQAQQQPGSPSRRDAGAMDRLRTSDDL
ncbi:hypothetical protein CEY15_14425 [Dietzia natronolimnaea]|uniref:DUF3710 domain-containing protein n=1 Tax=Dietzia natronolimnaea TaxID=161920 RepID=A0A2A2WML4_9ACTN|nr:DUF3710 domain-containing protein [Dietzia natronolimnaea]PAY22293.1 hypothetical protein CEY15_14425 [Dietzia natronolimnaea]